MRSKRKFKNELAKLFMMGAFGLVLAIGLLSQVSFKAIFFRIITGTLIFGVAGYLLGLIIDQEQERALVSEEKGKIKQKVKENYDKAVQQQQKQPQQPIDDDFSPIEIENLSKIIVESLKD